MVVVVDMIGMDWSPESWSIWILVVEWSTMMNEEKWIKTCLYTLLVLACFVVVHMIDHHPTPELLHSYASSIRTSNEIKARLLIDWMIWLNDMNASNDMIRSYPWSTNDIINIMMNDRANKQWKNVLNGSLRGKETFFQIFLSDYEIVLWVWKSDRQSLSKIKKNTIWRISYDVSFRGLFRCQICFRPLISPMIRKER